MEIERTFGSLVELLDINKGIKLYDAICDDSIFKIQFCIHDSKSRYLVHYLAEASNTFLNVFAKEDPGELKQDSECDDALIYEIRSSYDHELLDQICWLGSHLVWAMFKMEVIKTEIEQKYCEIFGAVSKSK